jgi:NADP-dependent 3-hydroxy acid dehydrogenase YdfG
MGHFQNGLNAAGTVAHWLALWRAAFIHPFLETTMESTSLRPLAVVTGASSGIGYHLAKCAAEHGYDLVLAADQPLDERGGRLRSLGAQVDAVQVDLASREGVDELYAACKGRRWTR